MVGVGAKMMSRKFFFYFLLGIAMVILCANLGLPPLSGSEGRWAVIARSMLRSGDLFSPTLGFYRYWDKPLLSYWQILPLSYLNGDVSEFTVRVPSVVWAVVMLLLTYYLAKRWYNEQTALMSVGTLATSYAFVFWGRNAQVEMANAAMILLSLWYFLKHKSDNQPTWVYLLGIMMALGANMKGLVLYAVPIFCILVLSLIKREWSWVPPLKILVTAGLLSFAVFLILPAIASMHSATWEPLYRIWWENVLRFFGLYDHKDPFYAYFFNIIYLAAPWSLILPVAMINYFQKVRRHVSQLPEPLILFGAIFLFFTLSRSRRYYYLLPVLPFVAILVANVLREFALGKLGRGIQSVVKGIGLLLGLTLIALLGGSLFFGPLFPVDTATHWFMFVLLALLCATMIISAMRKTIWGMVGSVAAVWLIYVLGVIPLIAEGPNLKTQIAEVKALGKPCGFIYIDDAKIFFYLDEPFQFFYDERLAIDWVNRTDGVLITYSNFSNESFECAVKGHHWQALIHRKHPISNDSNQSR